MKKHLMLKSIEAYKSKKECIFPTNTPKVASVLYKQSNLLIAYQQETLNTKEE